MPPISLFQSQITIPNSKIYPHLIHKKFRSYILSYLRHLRLVSKKASGYGGFEIRVFSLFRGLKQRLQRVAVASFGFPAPTPVTHSNRI